MTEPGTHDDTQDEPTVPTLPTVSTVTTEPPADDDYVTPEGLDVLDEVRAWWGRFIAADGDDLDMLTLWTAHTHVVDCTFTTPRLVIESVAPESGKTTVLDHLCKLAQWPLMMSNITSAAMLVRALDEGIRTLLIDEADRALARDTNDIRNIMSIVNSGYRKGASRPVLVRDGDDYKVVEMSTYAPVCITGNNLELPDDTLSRAIRLVLLPAGRLQPEESDWEVIEADAHRLHDRLVAWCDEHSPEMWPRPPMPKGITHRHRERWQPLKRIAIAAGGRWPETCDRLAVADVAHVKADREAGLLQNRPGVALLQDLATEWGSDIPTMKADRICQLLETRYPEHWGPDGPLGRSITPQRLGRLLVTVKIRSCKIYHDGTEERVYRRQDFERTWDRLGIGRCWHERVPTP